MVRSIFLNKEALSKNCTSGKEAVQKKDFFWGSTFAEKAAIVINVMFCKNFCLKNSSVDIDILNKFFFLNSSCSEKLGALRTTYSQELADW